MPLAVESMEGGLLDAHDLHAIKRSVVAGLALGDHRHIQLLLADLRVRNAKGWTEVDQLLGTLRAFEHVAPMASPFEIERNLHRFWAGGPLPKRAKANLLAMQALVTESAKSATPWRQFLWTSGTVNDGSDGFAELAAAGIEIIDADFLLGIGWAEQARDRDQVDRLSDFVRLVGVSSYGGVSLDVGIGPGTLTLDNQQLYHSDPRGEIGHHAPPFLVARDYADTLADATLGDSPRERIARRADAGIPVHHAFFASRSGTRRVARELAERYAQPSLTPGGPRFGGLFVVPGARPRYAPPQQRVTPWAADLAWF
jgi:hypothetical protein